MFGTCVNGDSCRRTRKGPVVTRFLSRGSRTVGLKTVPEPFIFGLDTFGVNRGLPTYFLVPESVLTEGSLTGLRSPFTSGMGRLRFESSVLTTVPTPHSVDRDVCSCRNPTLKIKRTFPSSYTGDSQECPRYQGRPRPSPLAPS